MVPTGRTVYDANSAYAKVVRATENIRFADDTWNNVRGYRYAAGATREAFGAAMLKVANAMGEHDKASAAAALTSALPLVRYQPEAWDAIKAMRDELSQ